LAPLLFWRDANRGRRGGYPQATPAFTAVKDVGMIEGARGWFCNTI
jgi:hypothetical protein